MEAQPEPHQQVPASGRVGPALGNQALLLSRGRHHRGGGVCFCYGHLFGLGGVLPAVGTVAGIVDARGTILVETVRDAALGLTFHKITLETGRRRSISKIGANTQKNKQSSTEPVGPSK